MQSYTAIGYTTQEDLQHSWLSGLTYLLTYVGHARNCTIEADARLRMRGTILIVCGRMHVRYTYSFTYKRDESREAAAASGLSHVISDRCDDRRGSAQRRDVMFMTSCCSIRQ